MSRIWPSADTGVEKVSRYKTLDTRDEARLIHQVSKSYRGDRNFLDRLTNYREGVEIAIRNTLRSSIDSLAVERCRAAIELYKLSTFSLVSWTDLMTSTFDFETQFFEILYHILDLPKYK